MRRSKLPAFVLPPSIEVEGLFGRPAMERTPANHGLWRLACQLGGELGIELEEGTRFLSNVVGLPAEKVEVGLEVECFFQELADGTKLPMFRPIPPARNESTLPNERANGPRRERVPCLRL